LLQMLGVELCEVRQVAAPNPTAGAAELLGHR